MNSDEKWKAHKATCATCSTAMSLDLCCKEGMGLYSARLADPSMKVRLTDKGKRGRA